MSDEPVAKALDNTDDRMPDPWVMPTPVFRTSEGSTPKSVRGRDEGELDETLEPHAQANSQAAAAVNAPPTPKPSVRVSIKGTPQAASGSWAKPVVAVLAIIVIGVLVIAAAIVYLYYSSTPPDTFH